MKVGEKRQFGFINKEMVIAEIITDSGIQMWWTWKSEVCPHCKEKIEIPALKKSWRPKCHRRASQSRNRDHHRRR